MPTCTCLRLSVHWCSNNNVGTQQEHLPRSNTFRVFRTRVRSNRKTDPGFGFRTQKMIQHDIPHAYIVSFFEKKKSIINNRYYIDRPISIVEKKKTRNISISRHTDRQSHKAFFLPTCLNIFRSVYGTRFARSSNSTGDYICD